MPAEKTYNCVIADDQTFDLMSAVAHAKRHDFLNIVGAFVKAEDVLAAAETLQPNVLIFDIDMGESNGFELCKKLQEVDACIFITAFPDYALESFEVSAFDFLVKPINADRFDRTMQRLKAYLDVKYKAQLFDHHMSGDAVFIKDGIDNVKILLRDILYLEALKDYTSIVTKQKKYCVLSSLGNLLKEPSFKDFVRVHRSYAVQKHFVSKMNKHEIIIDDVAVPVGGNYKQALDSLI